MFLLSTRKLNATNEQALDDLYYELKCDLGIIETYGQETIELMPLAEKTWSGVKYVAHKLQLLTSRIFISMRNLTEKVVLRYSSIVMRWHKRLNENINLIDPHKFGSRKINVVPQALLFARIDALVKLHHILDNIESICEAPISHTDGDWRTSEIKTAYSAMQSIGFDSNKFNLIGKVESDYDKARRKTTISELGYDVRDLGNVVEKLKPLARYAQSNSVTLLSKRFLDYSDKLKNYEMSLRETPDLDQDEVDQRKYILDIKLARLWWVSHFIKSSYVVANDICIDVLKICKVAELCIVHE